MACDRAQCVIHTVAEGGELGHVHVELLQRARIVRLVHLVRARLGVRARVRPQPWFPYAYPLSPLNLRYTSRIPPLCLH